ncbi:hypothetical protein ACFL6C_13955 [Myxococcota bacterium]
MAHGATAIWIWQGTRAKQLDKDAEKLHIRTTKFAETRNSANAAATTADISLVTALLAAGGATYFWLTVEF